MDLEEKRRPAYDREIDLRGEVCPITFARTRVALEEMAVGQVLRVLLDYEPATRNVPRSAELCGDKVLYVGSIGPQQWEVIIRRESP